MSDRTCRTDDFNIVSINAGGHEILQHLLKRLCWQSGLVLESCMDRSREVLIAVMAALAGRGKGFAPRAHARVAEQRIELSRSLLAPRSASSTTSMPTWLRYFRAERRRRRGTPRAAPVSDVYTQFSHFSPVTRSKCLTLLVTSTSFSAIACAAIMVSMLPMGVPRAMSVAASLP